MDSVNPTWWGTFMNPPGGQYTVNQPQDTSKFIGYDFAGHQGQTFDYSNPAEGAKYAVSNYLSSIDPTDKNWAYGAADALNKQFGSNIFNAVSGTRLNYGDEGVNTEQSGPWANKFVWTGAPQQPSGNMFGGFTGGGDMNQLNQTLQDLLKQVNTPKNVTWQRSQAVKPNYGFQGANPSYNMMQGQQM